jgi:hypothetical protein
VSVAAVVVVVAMVTVVVLVALGAGILWLFGCVCVCHRPRLYVPGALRRMLRAGARHACARACLRWFLNTESVCSCGA